MSMTTVSCSLKLILRAGLAFRHFAQWTTVTIVLMPLPFVGEYSSDENEIICMHILLEKPYDITFFCIHPYYYLRSRIQACLKCCEFKNITLQEMEAKKPRTVLPDVVIGHER